MRQYRLWAERTAPKSFGLAGALCLVFALPSASDTAMAAMLKSTKAEQPISSRTKPGRQTSRRRPGTFLGKALRFVGAPVLTQKGRKWTGKALKWTTLSALGTLLAVQVAGMGRAAYHAVLDKPGVSKDASWIRYSDVPWFAWEMLVAAEDSQFCNSVRKGVLPRLGNGFETMPFQNTRSLNGGVGAPWWKKPLWRLWEPSYRWLMSHEKHLEVYVNVGYFPGKATKNGKRSIHRGLLNAAKERYGKEPADLTPMQLYELFADLPAPARVTHKGKGRRALRMVKPLPDSCFECVPPEGFDRMEAKMKKFKLRKELFKGPFSAKKATYGAKARAYQKRVRKGKK